MYTINILMEFSGLTAERFGRVMDRWTVDVPADFGSVRYVNVTTVFRACVVERR